MSTVKRQFVRNTFSGWLAQLSAAIVGFIMFPYNLSHLGAEVYAISLLAVTAITLLQFLNLGMGSALLRFFSRAIAQNDRNEMAVLSSTAQLLLGGLGLVGCVIIVSGTPLFIRFYEIDPAHHFETRFLLYCMGFTFFLSFHSIVFGTVVAASNRYDLANLNGILLNWLRLGTLFFLYNVFTPSLVLLGVATLVGSVCSYVLIVWHSARLHGRGTVFFSPTKIRWSRLPSIFTLSTYSMLNSIGAVVAIQVSVMIIGKTLGKEMVAFFTPAVTITTYLAAIVGQIAAPLVPLAGRDSVETGGKNIGRWSIQMGRLVACAGYGCVFMVIFFIPDILRVWLGDKFVWTSPIVIVMVLGSVFVSIQSVNASLALGASTIIHNVYSTAVVAAVAVSGTFFGTTYWGWGLWEVALCITTIRIIRNVWFIPWIYSKLFSYRFSEYVFKVYVRPLLPGLLAAVVFLGLRRFVFASNPGFVILGAEIAAVAAVYALFTWYFGLGKEVQASILMIRKKRDT